MIGLDTNVLVRLVVSDDIRQTRAAVEFIQKTCRAENPGFVNLVVLCELAWALSQSCLSRDVIARAVEAILANPVLEVERRPLIIAALRRYRDGGPEFPDMVIGELNRANGCDTTATFDRKAAKLDGFTFVR